MKLGTKVVTTIVGVAVVIYVLLSYLQLEEVVKQCIVNKELINDIAMFRC